MRLLLLRLSLSVVCLAFKFCSFLLTGPFVATPEKQQAKQEQKQLGEHRRQHYAQEDTTRVDMQHPNHLGSHAIGKFRNKNPQKSKPTSYPKRRMKKGLQKITAARRKRLSKRSEGRNCEEKGVRRDEAQANPQ